MKLTNTQAQILAAAAAHPYRLVLPPERLPIPARQAVAKSLLKHGLVAEVDGAATDALARWTVDGKIAQIAEVTGWQQHTVRGFFAGLKKRQGIAVDAAERVRQVGPGKEGARGSYTIYRVAEAA